MIDNKKKALIHVAKQKLGLGDADYRAVLKRAGVGSSKDLTPAGFKIVMDHFKDLGFTPRRRQRGRGLPQNKARLAAKIFKMCAVMGKPNTYADGMARHMFGVDAVEFCDPQQLYKIVQALGVYARRAESRPRPRKGGK